MLYLLDASVLIDADEGLYPIARFPVFWDWLAYQAAAGAVRMPIEIFEKVKGKRGDPLHDWMRLDPKLSSLMIGSWQVAGGHSQACRSDRGRSLKTRTGGARNRSGRLSAFAVVGASWPLKEALNQKLIRLRDPEAPPWYRKYASHWA